MREPAKAEEQVQPAEQSAPTAQGGFDPQTIADFPNHPGVYIMKNSGGEVIYVGKAANLRNRVRNYFARSGDNRFSIPFLVKQVAAIDTVVTKTEKDAFLLENTLIKQHQPRYNIRLRDDKTYVSLCLRMNHEYPRLEVTRIRRDARTGARVSTGRHADPAPLPGKRRPKDNNLYFGPYTSSSSVRETLRFLLKVFPVRTCRDSVFRNRTRPCILFDVGKCCGPCTEPVSKEEYADLVHQVTAFLRGKDEEVCRALEQRMMECSENMQFEKAALIRDRLQAVRRTLERQQSATHEALDRDILAVASRQGRSLVILQEFRGGDLVHSREFYLKNYDQADEDVLYSFISQHYDSLAGGIPPEILTATEPCDRELLNEWLRDQRGGAVNLHVPQRGKLAGLAHTALQNARVAINRRLMGERTDEETLEELTRRLGLDRVPRTIECVDISNIMGVLAVGSIVRFEDAQPDKSGYRLFRIRSVEGSNDFAMMREVLMRRFRPDSTRAIEFPDLLLVDGGKGQLGIAEDVMRELGITTVQLASIAKSRLKVREAQPPKAARKAKPLSLSSPGGSQASGPEASPPRVLNTFFPDAPDYVGDNEPAPEVKIRRGNYARAFQIGAASEPQIAEQESVYDTRSAPPPAVPPATEVVRFRTEERVFLPGRKNPVTFPHNSPALFLVERIRDETHRTAITYHRKLRQKTNRKSVLDEVPGIGPKRKKLLLNHFGSLAALRDASIEQIASVDGVSREAAENVHRFLHADASSEEPLVMEIDDDLLPEGTEEAEDSEGLPVD